MRTFFLVGAFPQMMDDVSYKGSYQKTELELIWHRSLSHFCIDLRENLIAALTLDEVIQVEPELLSMSLMVGGQVGGIAGVFLSVPVAAVLRIVLIEYAAPEGSSSDALTKQALTEVEA